VKKSSASPRRTARRGSRRGTLSSNGRTLAIAVSCRCDAKGIHVTFDDGREVSVPLLPFLQEALPKERARCRVRAWGTELFWPDLDEVVGVNYVLGVPEDDLYVYAGFTKYSDPSRDSAL